MRDDKLALLAPLAALALAACATDRTAATDGETSPQMAPFDSQLQQYQIESWRAPDDETLIVESRDGSIYRARLLSHCNGLRFAQTVAFVTRGTSRVDRFAGVVLPDGTRCTFETFERVPSARTAEGEAEGRGEAE